MKVQVDLQERTIHAEKLAADHRQTNSLQAWDAPVEWVRAQVDNSNPPFTVCKDCFKADDPINRRTFGGAATAKPEAEGAPVVNG